MLRISPNSNNTFKIWWFLAPQCRHVCHETDNNDFIAILIYKLELYIGISFWIIFISIENWSRLFNRMLNFKIFFKVLLLQSIFPVSIMSNKILNKPLKSSISYHFLNYLYLDDWIKMLRRFFVLCRYLPIKIRCSDFKFKYIYVSRSNQPKKSS